MTTQAESGENLAPGAMIYFSDPNVRINSIDCLNDRKMRVKVEAVQAIPRGTKIDVMVLNPDNRSAEKAGLIRVR